MGDGYTEIVISPSLLDAMGTSVNDLVQDPYGCVEQTMSRFVPAMVVQQFYANSGMTKPSFLDRIPELRAMGLQRIESLSQQGGWGWFSDKKPDPWLTALVLDGLQVAKIQRSELHVNWGEIDNSVKEMLKPSSDFSLTDKLNLAAAWATPEKGAFVEPLIKSLRLASLDSLQTAYLLRTLQRIGDTSPLRGRLRLRILELANRSSGETHWGWPSEELRHTAECIRALAAEKGDREILASAANFLFQNRTGGMWRSTAETTMVIIALSSFADAQQFAGAASTSVRVSVNGTEVAAMSPRVDLLESKTLRIPGSALREGTNEIALSGSSSYVYWAAARSYLPKQRYQAQTKVSRSYRVFELSTDDRGKRFMRPSKKPAESAKKGDLIEVTVEVTSDYPHKFVLIEDPTPSNCMSAEESTELIESPSWNYQWINLEVRDDRVAAFFNAIPAGKFSFTYLLRANRLGKSIARPVKFEPMYAPERSAFSSPSTLEVRP
jgi:uncharacterized protein YfaS (alpha-2-macroglobulin family)